MSVKLPKGWDGAEPLQHAVKILSDDSTGCNEVDKYEVNRRRHNDKHICVRMTWMGIRLNIQMKEIIVPQPVK